MTFLGNTSPYYGGGQVAHPPNVLTNIAGKPPTTFKAPIGTISIDHNLKEAWMLVADAAGVGYWASITGGAGGNVDTLTGNTGGAIAPQAGNINVVGSGSISVVGDNGTGTLTISSGAPTGVVETITGNVGGAVPPNGGGDISIVGSGTILVSGNIGSNTLTISSSAPADFAWNLTTTTPVMLVPNNGYNPNFVGTTVYVLPGTCAYGQVIEIGGYGVGLWQITQNAGQNILVGLQATTVGVGGSITSTFQTDCIRLLCIQANMQFLALSSFGNLTVV